MLSAPPPDSKFDERSINILFLDSLTERTFVPCGISEVKPFDFSHLLGAATSSFIAYLKQEASISVLQVRLTALSLPF